MLAILGLIPGLLSFFDSISTKLFDARVRLVQARIGGDRDVAVELVKAAASKEHENTSKLSIISSNKLLTALLVLAAIPLIGFEWKVIVCDKMLRWCEATDPIKGQVADWANTVWYFLFGSPTVLGVAKMWFGRDKTGQ